MHIFVSGAIKQSVILDDSISDVVPYGQVCFVKFLQYEPAGHGSQKSVGSVSSPVDLVSWYL